MPEIISHLGPKQVGHLKELFGNMGKGNSTIKEENEDEVPELV